VTNADQQLSFLDVRKAQRLVHSYNLRVMEMAREIDRAMVGLKFSAALLECDMDEIGNWKPGSEEIGLGESVPLQTLAFSWSTQTAGGPAGPKDRMFVACFCADTDYWAVEDENIDTWSLPETTRSVVTLMLGHPTKELKNASPSKFWYAIDYSETEYLTATKSKGYLYVIDEVELSEVPTKTTLTERVRSFMESAENLIASR
jgi:hypothetical protein